MTVQYKVQTLPYLLEDLETYLNGIGATGWELIGINPAGQAFFQSGSSIDGISLTGSLVIPAGTVSSSAQVKAYLPAGTVSSSGQVDVRNTTGITVIATTGSNTFVGDQTVSGSIVLEDSSFINTGWLYDYNTSGSLAWNNRQLYDDVENTSLNWQSRQLLDDTGASAVLSWGGSTPEFFGTSSLAVSASYVRMGQVNTNYGQWYSTTSQSGSANTVIPMTYDSQSFARGFTYSGSRLYAEVPGIYNLQFSAQFYNTVNTEVEIDVWLRQDDQNVPDSNTLYYINKVGGSGRGTVVAALNYLVQMTSGSYVELVFSNTGGTSLNLYFTGSGDNPVRPRVPSIITTIAQVH